MLNKKLKQTMKAAIDEANKPENIIANLAVAIQADYNHYCELLRKDEVAMTEEEYTKKWILARVPKEITESKAE
jgi:uncharacterized short protein YbdD (DUF466 family)